MKSTNLCFFLFLTFFFCRAQDKIEVFFDFNKSDLNSVAKSTLNNWITINPGIKVHKIYGFCDSIGSNQYNDVLSLHRIQSVFDYLTKQKIYTDNEYEQKGFGKNFPQNKIQYLNRKVTIYFSVPSLYPSLKKQEHTLSDKVKHAKKGDLLRLQNIHFFNNSAQIVPNSKTVLFDLLLVMQENPNLKIEIQGHICCQSSNSMDYISEARARAIYDYLVINNIQRNRLTYKGFGVSKPVHSIPEQSASQEDENRRVEIEIIEN